MPERRTNPRRVGDLIDLDQFRVDADTLREASERRAAEVEAERQARLDAMTPEERRASRVSFLRRLGFGDRVADAAGHRPPGEGDESEARGIIRTWTVARIKYRAGKGPRAPWACALLGKNGIGKTFDAARWCLWARSQVAEREINVVRARDFMRIDLYDKEGAIEAIAGRRYTVLDDLGTEYLDAGGACLSKLETFFDLRYEMDGDTLITGNPMDLRQLAQRYRGRIMDRVGDAAWHVLRDTRSKRWIT